MSSTIVDASVSIEETVAGVRNSVGICGLICDTLLTVLKLYMIRTMVRAPITPKTKHTVQIGIVRMYDLMCIVYAICIVRSCAENSEDIHRTARRPHSVGIVLGWANIESV